MENRDYELLSIVLVESSFKRLPTPDFPKDASSLDNQFGIDTNYHVNDDEQLSVFVNTAFTTTNKDEKSGGEHKQDPLVRYDIVMVGIFKVHEQKNISLEKFANINAPAIVFPFIREHMFNLSQKGGIAQILLPPVNFVKLAKQKQIN